MKVNISEAAKADLIAIQDWIAAENPERATTFVNELLNCCAELEDRPTIYPVVSRYASLGIRRRLFRSYLIFYRVSEDMIDIIHILHGSRDYEALLGAE